MMGAAGGPSVGLSPNQQLVADIAQANEQRGRRWRTKFLVTWAIIVAGLVAFILVTVNVDIRSSSRSGSRSSSRASRSRCSWRSPRSSSRRSSRRSGALGRLSRNPYLNGIASFYVSFFRGTPLLLQILFIYLALPQAGIVLPGDPDRDRRPQPQLRLVHDRGLPVRHRGRPARPDRGRPSLGMTGAHDVPADHRAAGVPDRDPGDRQRLRGDDQGLLAGVGRRRPGAPVARADGRAPDVPVDADAAGGRVHLLGPDDPLLAVPGPPREADGDGRSSPEATRNDDRACHRTRQKCRAIIVQPGAEPIVKATAIEKHFDDHHVLRGCSMTVYPGRDRDDPGPVGVGQEHVPALSQLPRGADGRRVDIGGVVVEAEPHEAPRSSGRGADPPAPAARRDGVPGVQPVPAPDRHRQPHRGADPRQGHGPQGGDRAGRGEPREGRAQREARRVPVAACRAASASAWRSPGR